MKYALMGLALLPGMAVAQFAPPPGCEVTLTAQERGCAVDHIVVCEALPDGHQWHFTLTGNGGWQASLIDGDTNWVRTLAAGGFERTLDESSRDPSDFDALLSTGRDDCDFVTHDSTGVKTRYIGYDALTGDSVNIDGQTLLVTEFDMRAFSEDGTETRHVTGTQFASKVLRRFYGGTHTNEVDGDTFVTEHGPVEFYYPGQPGFSSDIPKYDCEASEASAQAMTLPPTYLEVSQ
ncbi:MAG: hypothetical protein AAF386_10550 [Pseudomonadota bacterium]